MPKQIKHRDECLFCSSRSCRNRLITAGLDYDEISCHDHVDEMFRDFHAQKPGRVNQYILSSDNQRRGAPVEFLTSERFDQILGKKKLAEVTA